MLLHDVQVAGQKILGELRREPFAWALGRKRRDEMEN